MSAVHGARNRGTIRFVLDGDIIEVENVDPNRTVLQFLREDLHRTGTKEGCAEGDCGACTVVIADIDRSGERLRAQAINSCIQFLPTLDGKELITVESLATDALHPAQQAMVDCHGSQCGFCTPGFVMSLFALYKNNENPDRRQVDDALAGNLCRCTGYQSIVNAATKMYELAPDEGDWPQLPAGGRTSADETERVERIASLANGESLFVDCDGRRFYAPRSVAELADLVAALPDATILAGGTDIGLWVTKQQRELDTVVYAGRVVELNSIEVSGTHIEIGAVATLTDVMPLIARHYPSLEELFLRFASPPIRNAGTLGGNIANGSPIGDSMPALLVLGAELLLRSGAETRTLPLDEFYVGYQQTALREGEFVERIRIPLPGDGVQVRSYKVSKRFDQDISAVCGAYRLTLSNGIVEDVRVAYGGMAEIPKRAGNCERSLVGAEWNDAAVAAGMDALDTDFTPISDMRSSSRYRREVCRNLLQRFFLETVGNDCGNVYTYGR